MGLPIEGIRDGKYVIVCPHGCCRAYTADEIFKIDMKYDISLFNNLSQYQISILILKIWNFYNS